MSAATQAPPHLRNLRRRIGTVRRKRVAVSVMTGAALALSTLIAITTAEGSLDWLTDLPWLMRALFLAAALSGAGWFVWRDIVRSLCTKLNDYAVARLIERALPSFQTRYIASIQLACEQELPSAFIRGLLAETDAMAVALDFGAVVKLAHLRRALLLAGFVLAAAVGLGWYGWPATLPLLQRAALLQVPVPRKTQITNLTGDRRIGIGEDLRIEAIAGGIVPAHGSIVATMEKGQKREFALEPEPDQRGHFSALIRSPQTSFSYVIRLNDATSFSAQITTLPRPVVVQLTCRQTFPAYLKMPPVARLPGDLRLLAGSRLSITVKASASLSAATLRLTGVKRELPLRIDPRTPALLQGELDIPAKDLTGFSIHMVDTAGIESGETATYRIDLVPDQPPTVRVTYPTRREELATPAATTRIAFEAKDDFGVSQAVLHYTLGQGSERKIPFDLGGDAGKVVTRRFDWKLTSLKPRPAIGDILEFWITVTDTNTVTGPGAATTEHFQTRIVTDDEKRLDLANRLSDTMGGLGEVAGSQEQLNKILGEAIFARPSE